MSAKILVAAQIGCDVGGSVRWHGACRVVSDITGAGRWVGIVFIGPYCHAAECNT